MERKTPLVMEIIEGI